MERFLKDKEVKPNELSPLTLAFIGDTVFDLLVREELICDANRPATTCTIWRLNVSERRRRHRALKK